MHFLFLKKHLPYEAIRKCNFFISNEAEFKLKLSFPSIVLFLLLLFFDFFIAEFSNSPW